MRHCSAARVSRTASRGRPLPHQPGRLRTKQANTLEFRPARRHLPFDALKEGVVADQNLLQGTLDMLVLKTLRLGPMHGWGIAERIRSEEHTSELQSRFGISY